MKRIVFLLACLGALIAQSATAQRTITVGPGRDYPTIQAAIDGASEGDTIIVYPGRYLGTIRITKNIILRSTDPTDPDIVAATIIDGNQWGVTVTFAEGAATDNCVLSGFTITGGCDEGNVGGGIMGYYTCALIEHNIITGNSGSHIVGGIVACSGTIRNNIIKGTLLYLWGRGGGLYECHGTIENNTIVGNQFSGLNNCNGIIRNNIIAGNFPGKNMPGGCGLFECRGTIQNNTIVGNISNSGVAAGIYYCHGIITNNIVWGNRSASPTGPYQIQECSTPTYSCIEGWTAGGVGNVAADPFFVPGTTGGESSTYLLSPDSPCIDGGNPASEFNDGHRPPGQGTLRNDMGVYGGPNNMGWFLGKFIVVRAPNGGESFGFRTLQEIRWDSSPGILKVNILFSFRNGGLQTQPLATGILNTGTMRWTLPAFAAEDCSIRVVDADDPATSDTSDTPFRIVAEPPAYRVLSPNGGEIYLWGDTIPIRWASSCASRWAGIHYTLDGGQTWNLLVAETINNGEYLWPAPHVNSNQCRVSVFDVAPVWPLAPAFDMSDGDFWISDPVSILPNFRITAADFHPSAPAQMKPGDPLAISALVENTGKTPTGPAWLEVWGSRTGGITLDYFLCESVRLGAPIPAGGSFSLNMTRPLASVPDGPYTVVYVVDRLDEVDEGQEGDNRFVVARKRLLSIRPPTRANLTIEGLQIGPNPLVNGQPVAFGGWVRNIGTQDSGAFWIEFWGSINRVFPQTDFFLCESAWVPNLPAGQSIALGSYTRNLYLCPFGVFMAGVFVDRPDAVNETNETDNYAFIDGISFAGSNPSPNVAPMENPAAWQQAEADLAVVNGDFSPAGPVTIAPGAPINISTRVENRGAADSGPFWLEFWGSRTGGLMLDEFICDSVYVPNIAVGQAFEASRSMPLYSMADGPYTFTVVADRMGAVADANPRNNRLAVAGKRVLTIRPQTQANLRTENFAVTTTTLHRGQLIPMSGQVRNTGAQDTGPFWVEFWGSLNQMYPDLNFFLCDSINVPNLAAGEALDLAANPRTLYETTPMVPCMILCFPDRPDCVNETDESDNPAAIAGCLIAP